MKIIVLGKDAISLNLQRNASSVPKMTGGGMTNKDIGLHKDYQVLFILQENIIPSENIFMGPPTGKVCYTI